VNTLTIESSQVGNEGERASLTLGPYERDTFLAEARHDRLRASARIVSKRFRGRTTEGLEEFFRGIAADWKGWDGKREWASVERDLVLSATGHSGRVDLGVHLHYAAPPDWELDFTLPLEASQLDRLAADASEFEQSAARAS
jgi:hypothetical protein